MVKHMTKNDYETWTRINKASKSQVVDAIIELLEDETIRQYWTVEDHCIIEMFKKMNDRKMDNTLFNTKKELLEFGVPEKDIVKVV